MIYLTLLLRVLMYVWRVDKYWLDENLLCLVSNAVKYSTGGEVIVEVKLCSEDHLPGSLQQSPSQNNLPSVDSLRFSTNESHRLVHEKNTFSASLIARSESKSVSLHPTRQMFFKPKKVYPDGDGVSTSLDAHNYSSKSGFMRGEVGSHRVSHFSRVGVGEGSSKSLSTVKQDSPRAIMYLLFEVRDTVSYNCSASF